MNLDNSDLVDDVSFQLDVEQEKACVNKIKTSVQVKNCLIEDKGYVKEQDLESFKAGRPAYTMDDHICLLEDDKISNENLFESGRPKFNTLNNQHKIKRNFKDGSLKLFENCDQYKDSTNLYRVRQAIKSDGTKQDSTSILNIMSKLASNKRPTLP